MWGRGELFGTNRKPCLTLGDAGVKFTTQWKVGFGANIRLRFQPNWNQTCTNPEVNLSLARVQLSGIVHMHAFQV